MIVPVSASVTLTRLHPWHWLSVIYTQYLCAPVTLTICTRDIDLTECDLHSVPAFVRLTILHSWHWPFLLQKFWTNIFVYYPRPPLWSKGQISIHIPSNKNHAIITSTVYSSVGPQSKDGSVCVTGEGPGGATWPLAKPIITLARGQVAPPGPSPVAHTLPSLDWGL